MVATRPAGCSVFLVEDEVMIRMMVADMLEELGYSVAAELRPETPYEEMVEALGCDGILVREPKELRPALERAFASGRPTLVNVLTDPEVVYPRKSNLA